MLSGEDRWNTVIDLICESFISQDLGIVNHFTGRHGSRVRRVREEGWQGGGVEEKAREKEEGCRVFEVSFKRVAWPNASSFERDVTALITQLFCSRSVLSSSRVIEKRIDFSRPNVATDSLCFREERWKDGERKKLQSSKRKSSASDEKNVENYSEDLVETNEESGKSHKSRNKKLKEKENIDIKGKSSYESPKRKSKKKSKYSEASQTVHEKDSKKLKDEKVKEETVEERNNVKNEKKSKDKNVDKSARTKKDGKKKKLQKKEKEVTVEEVEKEPVEVEETEETKTKSKKSKKKSKKDNHEMNRKKREVPKKRKEEEVGTEIVIPEEEEISEVDAVAGKSCSITKEIQDEEMREDCGDEKCNEA